MNYLTNIAIVARRIIFSNIVLEILVLFITNFADMYEYYGEYYDVYFSLKISQN